MQVNMDRDPATLLIANNLARLMDERGINATALAETSGLNRTAIYDIMSERSKSPKISTVAKIAAGLNVPLSDLFLTVSQIEGQAELMRLFASLDPGEQQKLSQIAKAWSDEI
jgi:transcriptional regulator with XRE-family HTH domain